MRFAAENSPLVLPWPLPRTLEAATRALLDPGDQSSADFSKPTGESALVSPDSVSWRVFKNPVSLFVGGVTAVIMELAEPRVRTGVWEHTTFRVNPIRRLRRTGRAAANDDEALIGSCVVRKAWGRRKGNWIPYSNQIVLDRNFPARQRLECRRCQRFARAQAEAGMMPWAAHGVVDHQSLVKRSAQMATGVANSEDVVAEPREKRLCTADMASLHPAIGYVSHSNTSGKIGSEVGRVAQGFL